MTLFFPDINIWMALSVEGHIHNKPAARWLNFVRREDRLIFSRYTQMGFLRLLTNNSVMGGRVLRTIEAWAAFDRWLSDPRVEFYPEPSSVDASFRQATASFAGQSAPKWIGDSYLLAFARECSATLVTFDLGLHGMAVKTGYRVEIPK